jgi:hypothetical protein
MKTIPELLKQLKESPEKLPEILPDLFPEREKYTVVWDSYYWLSTAPSVLSPILHKLAELVVKHLEPEPETLGELHKLSHIGTMFETAETKELYQLAGKTKQVDGVTKDDLIAVRAFNSEFVTHLPASTKIMRIF